MPSGLIEQEHGMFARRDLGGDLGEMQAHRLGVAVRQHQCGTLALAGADGAEDVGRRGALIVRCTGTTAAPGPTTGDLVLLTDPGFVGEPDFYVGTCDVLCRGDFLQAGGKVFLNASIAPSACA